MDPVLDEVGQQRVETRCDRPEHWDDCSCECAIFCRKQLTRHHKTRHTDPLSTHHHGVYVYCILRCSTVNRKSKCRYNPWMLATACTGRFDSLGVYVSDSCNKLLTPLSAVIYRWYEVMNYNDMDIHTKVFSSFPIFSVIWMSIEHPINTLTLTTYNLQAGSVTLMLLNARFACGEALTTS